jgi:hypothetical protein
VGLVDDFQKIIDLCVQLEPASRGVHAGVSKRIANAYARAIEKAITISWYGDNLEVPTNEQINKTLFRHAERGARDYVPTTQAD